MNISKSISIYHSDLQTQKLNPISDVADIRLFDYPNRIRLFLGLPSPTFWGEIPIQPFP